jgi:hypothetical protein
VDETTNGTEDIWKISEGLDYPRFWWEKYGGGTGEPNNPYLIYTAKHLNEMSAEPNDYDKHFKLMADIDLSGYTYDRAVIAPDVNDIDGRFQGTSFTGVLNGNGHTISNLTITGQNYVGLFGQIMFADVIDLGIVDANITGLDYIGGLVGSSNHAHEVARCYSECRVKGINGVGGLIGSNHLSSVNQCYSRCTVTGESTVGGLVGTNLGGLIENSYSTSQVSGNSYVCGLVARNSGGLYNAKGRMINCYNAGIVSGTDRIDALVWVTWGGSMPANCFWDMETSGQASGFLSMGRTTAEMQTAHTFLEAGWDFVDETDNGVEDIWWIDEGNDYPRLWWELIPEN